LTGVKISKKKSAVNEFIKKRFGVENPELAQKIASASVISVKKKKDIIFSQGQEISHTFFIVSGLVKLFRTSEEGRDIVLKYSSAGESFANGIMGGHSLLSASALEDSELLVIDKSAVKNEVLKNPHLLENLLKSCKREFDFYMSYIENISMTDTRKRLEKYLREHSKKNMSDTVRLPVPRCELAILLGCTPENLSRIIKQMTADGHITIKGRDIRINF